MKISDYRFNNDFIKSFVGQNFDEFKHKKIISNNSVSQNCYFKINNINCELFNDYEEFDYLGIDNEATIWNIKEAETNDLPEDANDNNCIFKINEKNRIH